MLFAQLFQLVSVSFLPTWELRMLDFFTIDPGNYIVVGRRLTKAQATIAANSSAVQAWSALIISCFGGSCRTCHYYLLCYQRIKGGILSILTTTVLAIAVGLVDLSSIDFANNHVGAAFEDLKTVFGAALVQKVWEL